MSARLAPTRSPELELVDSTRGAIRYLEHGYPSTLVRWHCHDEFELHYIVATSGKLFVGDHIGRFEPGQLVLTGPYLPHNWVSEDIGADGVALRDRVVQFGHRTVRDLAASVPELARLSPVLDRASYGIEFLDSTRTRAERLMCRIRDTAGPIRFGHFLVLMQLLIESDEYRLLSTVSMRSRIDDPRLDKVGITMRYVTDGYRSSLSLASAAERVGMSESAFSRFFSRATGCGFATFVNRVRIAKACELLSDTEDQITSICFAVGYRSVANFNRRFRELKGVSPRSYREQSRLRHGERQSDSSVTATTQGGSAKSSQSANR